MTLAATILNAIFALSLQHSVTAIQLLACIALAVNFLSTCGLVFIVSRYIPKIKEASTGWSTALCWRFLGMPIAIASVAASLSFITLVWTVVRMGDLPDRIAGRSSRTIVVAWFNIWGVSAGLQIGTFVFISWWTKRALYNRSIAAMDLDFGAGSPEMGQSLQPRPTSESFRSQDPTLTSPPQTPTTIGFSSPFRSSHSGGKGGPTSSRTRLVHSTSFTRESAKSSFDYPTGEAVSIDHSFDNWDTSGVTREVRTTLKSTPPVTRSGLETIPGSRPESPAKTLDGPFLPDSPLATLSDAETNVDSCEHPSSPKASISSPPSSPPNFSRPTSRQINQPRMNSSSFNAPSLDPPPENLIHPLFRPSSPQPAPVATAGTMLTASPLAGQSITPKTLTRMRSASMPQQPSPLKESEVAPPIPDPDPTTSGAGSPGPSIIDDEELPPVIPGFILSAGQRTSFVGYGKRKSVKSRSSSFHSQGSRVSMAML
jgi:hypothetical protein